MQYDFWTDSMIYVPPALRFLKGCVVVLFLVAWIVGPLCEPKNKNKPGQIQAFPIGKAERDAKAAALRAWRKANR